MSALRADRERLKAIVAAPLTVRGYASDWKLFDRWCERAGKSSLPASPDTTGLYATWMLEVKGRRTSTVERHVSAIAHYHRQARLASPVTCDIRQILIAARRERKEKPQGKAALEVQHLVSVAKTCDPLTSIGARDRALIVLGFATSMRRSELALLDLSDIIFHRQGLSVHLRFSKTDQAGKGRHIAVWAGERVCTDPVSTMRDWIDRRGAWAGPLFARIARRGDAVIRAGISGEAINELVKRAIARAGLDPSGYGAHSLRAGAITACAELGRSNQEIMDLSGHESETVMRKYIRGTRLFSGRNPLAGAL